MNELESPKEVFKNIEDGDEITVETEYGFVYNREVIDDNDPRLDLDPIEQKYVFGSFEQCQYLVFTFGSVQVKKIQSSGELEANGESVLTITNFTKEQWAGENNELK